MGRKEHVKDAPRQLRVAIITVSSTRTLADDQSGAWMRQQAEAEGHMVVLHQVVSDDRPQIADLVKKTVGTHSPHLLITTGGTGLTPQDVTIESIRPLFEKEMTAFAVLFTQLSYSEIASAALLSRAVAGVIGKSAVFCLPGSLNACKLACKALIFPEAGHIVAHVCSI